MTKNRQNGLYRRAVSGALTVGALLLPASNMLRAQDAPATYTYSVLYTFSGGTDGGLPYAGVVRDRWGNLYGTTSYGGNSSNPSCAFSTCGVVFKVDPSGTETVLYNFTGGADGGEAAYCFDPTLIRDEAGNLYGTTSGGGDLSGCNGAGCGVVFKVDPSGTETVLHTFTAGADGASGFFAPTLLRDEAGSLFGTAYAGGPQRCSGEDSTPGCGVVYKIDPSHKETVLHSFKGGTDGENPNPFGSLARDKAGNLYGATTYGPVIGATTYSGKIFKLDPAGQETALYLFKGGADGGRPNGGLIRDEDGNLYGTAAAGGNTTSACGGPCGVVFKLSPAGKQTVLHSFTGGADGGVPYAPLVRDRAGNLYGTTLFGGDVPCGGCGVVYKLDPAGNETVLYTFTGGPDGTAPYDGVVPYAGLFLDEEGNLYGTTAAGGDVNGCSCGVVFKLTRSAAGGQ